MISLPSTCLHLLSVSFLLVLACCPLPCHSTTHKVGDETHHVLQVKSLLPSSVCSSSQATNTTGIKIFHRHGPCSPHRTKQPTVAQFFHQDESRANSIRRRRHLHRAAKTTAEDTSSTESLMTTIPASIGHSFGSGNYIVTIGLGTPKRDFTVMFDTGSDITWVQCQPCVRRCYSQQEPIFDPTKSSTYTNVSCSSPVCAALRSATGHAGSCSASHCVYGIQYGDGSYSVGFFAKETLTLSSYDVIPSFVFGCGEKNKGLYGRTAGLLGLGRNRLSLVSQAARKYKNVFSYCLPSTSSSIGYLSLGPDYTSSSFSAVQFTPMLVDSSLPSFYFLDLIGIKVGGRKLTIPSTVFQTAGTIIDSGTTITRLPPKAHAALRTAFRKAMSKYPRAPAMLILDTCYDLSKNDTVAIPTVELLFRGRTSLKVDVTGIIFVRKLSQVCLAFAGNDDPSDTGIIGNMQQRTMKVVYDVAKGGIGFSAGGCS